MRVNRISYEPSMPPRTKETEERFYAALIEELRELRRVINELVDNQREAKKMAEL